MNLCAKLKIYDGFIDIRDFDKDVACFDAPGEGAIMELQPGDCLEVNHDGERFWTTFIEFCKPCDIITKVLSQLVFNHPFQTRDNIKFAKWNIYSIDKECLRWKL